jgi:hypothetical protein
MKLLAIENLLKGIKNPTRKISYMQNFLKGLMPKKITSARQLGVYKSYSQAYQDVFVREMLQNKSDGVYVEVGAYDEIDHSNSFILEIKNSWTGFSLEIDQQAASDFNQVRKNKCICTDATLFNFEKHFKDQRYPKQIDYLSLDIEPAIQTLKVLKSLPLDSYRFSIITYEHDNYVSGSDCMMESRKIFESYCYKLIVSNVRWEGRDFEDWYVDPRIVPEKIWSRFIANDIDCLEVFKRAGVT